MPQSSGNTPSFLKRVERLNPASDAALPRYAEEAYLPRPADGAARAALRRGARQSKAAAAPAPLGICIVGRAMLGKTRLAWEAMRAELPGWMFLRWAPGLWPAFDLSSPIRLEGGAAPAPPLTGVGASWRGKRVVLFIDAAQRFANPYEAVLLNSLPEECARAGARLVVIVTCRAGADEAAARQHLGPLLDRLTLIALDELSAAEADQLTALLKDAGVETKREQFDGTPGSMLLDVENLRDVGHPALPEPAQRVLRAMKLLHSAGISASPAPRLRAAAIDLFALDARDWPGALDALAQAGFVSLDASGEQVIAPDVSLERAVPDDLPQGEELSAAWSHLEASLRRRRDADALISLGVAFSQRPADAQRAHWQQAGACYQAALEVYTRESAPIAWALAQIALGDALKHEADLAPGGEQTALLGQAVDAYRAALEVFSRDRLPLGWALAQNNQGNARTAQARLAVGAVRAGLLEQALAAYRAALDVRARERLPAEWAATQNNLGQALGVQVQLAVGAERSGLLEQEIACYRAALEVYTQQSMPGAWAAIQNNLGNALRSQAESAEKASRTALLSQAVGAYRAALEVARREETPALWAMVHNNLGIALSAQAGQVVGPIQALLLGQAIEAYRAAQEVRTREQMPSAWAMTQSNLGAALRGQAGLIAGQARADLLGVAAQVYRSVLTVYTRESMPAAWAGTQFNLAVIHLDHAAALAAESNDAACQALRDASRCVEQAREVYTQAVTPANYQATLGLRERIRERMQALGCEPGGASG